jgi:hypothetical protein
MSAGPVEYSGVSGPGVSGCSLGSWPVDRIAIIGCGGSGKSHLSRSLGILLGITPVHLDGLYYDQDWKPMAKEQFAVLQRNLVTAPRWIIDGNYVSSLPIRLQAADTVIFLDLRLAASPPRRPRLPRRREPASFPLPRGGHGQ